MKIDIVSISNKLSSTSQPVLDEYLKQLRWPCKFIDIKTDKSFNSIITQKSFEAGLILNKLHANNYVICLDENGEQCSSKEFATKLAHLSDNGNNVSFVIGGAYGLDDSIKQKANFCLSLSKMTLPHKLAKLFLVEQLYRAQQIINNHPYHK